MLGILWREYVTASNLRVSLTTTSYSLKIAGDTIAAWRPRGSTWAAEHNEAPISTVTNIRFILSKTWAKLWDERSRAN